MQELRLSNRDLENMLWDRLLYDQLLKSGKSIVVDKTPHNTLSWRRIHRYWPGAKFILLHRHPVRMMESMRKAHPKTPPQHWGEQILRFAKAMDEANEGARRPDAALRGTHPRPACADAAHLRVPRTCRGRPA